MSGRPAAGSEPAADQALRAAVVAACRDLTRTGLTPGKTGNVSLRRNERQFFVSPTGMAYDSLEPDDIPLVDLDGRWYGARRPSSEWRFHRDLFESRREVNAIVHTHSPYATALACTGRGIPAFHYMVAAAGGEDVRCAPYHAFGTQALSEAALTALAGRRACLLANHGVIAVGATVSAAFALAAEVESLALQYGAALALGEVHILDAEQIRVVLDKFRTYGRQDVAEPGLDFGGRELPGPAAGMVR